jgi:hypothetical protein
VQVHDSTSGSRRLAFGRFRCGCIFGFSRFDRLPSWMSCFDPGLERLWLERTPIAWHGWWSEGEHARQEKWASESTGHG